MFTGLVQGIGEIDSIRQGNGDCRLAICPTFKMDELKNGESIAVNGACLTVEEHGQGRFWAYVSAESLAHTNLGRLRQGQKVNLERALALGERLGGHLVSGHVDCQAELSELETRGQSTFCRFVFPKVYGPEVAPKGSVTLDGISLTVNACGEDFLEVNLIPETRVRTTMNLWHKGLLVNMETDLIAKYVRALLRPWAVSELARGKPASADKPPLSREILLEHGFI